MLTEETVASLEKDYNEFEEKKKWNILYHEIRMDAQQFEFTCKAAKRIDNRPFNRYRDVNPYDHARIRLHRGKVSYINASRVEVPAARRRYILTQGPLPNTAGHFWLLVWEQKSRAIIMLNKTIEKNQIKCHQYWPLGSGPEHRLELEDVRLSVELVSQTDCNYYTVSSLKLTDHKHEGESREILHYHYTTWPDFGIPESPRAFLLFLAAVREAGVLEEEVGPAVVHCSAGIGRSGTFSLVDSYLLMLERDCVDGQSIQSVLLAMRRYRMGLIQTSEQLKFSYQAIAEGVRALLTHGSLCDLANGSSSPLKRKQPEKDEEEEEEVEEPPPPPPRAESLGHNRSEEAAEPQTSTDVYNPEHLNAGRVSQSPPPEKKRRRLSRRSSSSSSGSPSRPASLQSPESPPADSRSSPPHRS